MSKAIDLESYIAGLAVQGVMSRDVTSVIAALDGAGRQLARLIARGHCIGGLAESLRPGCGAGDIQKKLDIIAHQTMIEAMQEAPIGWLASEESEDIVPIRPGAPFSMAIDPLDGSSNIETNAPIGTIFSVMPSSPDGGSRTFRQPGSAQIAAGFFIFGPQSMLFLTVGNGTDVFTLDPDSGVFVLTTRGIRVPHNTGEFAINCSNERHWAPSVRHYVEDCVSGFDGPRGKDFNMRWIASMVAEAQRILVRGGIYLYPRDNREGYENGRLRLIYEANPIGFLIEQAGGSATDGRDRILDIEPSHLHQRTPLVFGSSGEVEHFQNYARGIGGSDRRSPLFSERGLFRQ